MTEDIEKTLIQWAEKYNDPKYFQEDPIAFPRKFVSMGASLKDIEVAAVFSAHFAWGRRAMIVRDLTRLFDHMEWKPYDYVMKGEWRDEPLSVHRTIKWCDCAAICSRLKDYYGGYDSLESLSQDDIRTLIYGQKSDPKAPNKKINMMRRWMVRDDGKVDLGLWKNTSPSELLIPLDVHVHTQASALGLTSRNQKDIVTVKEITSAFDGIFPGDPCKGDFALFGYGVTHAKNPEKIINPAV
ncbi:MAG: TIGR02757 family protein [Bacteroidales bacterium]|nr:TIGR02757 family protein [Bacteroidales bacterium]